MWIENDFMNASPQIPNPKSQIPNPCVSKGRRGTSVSESESEGEGEKGGRQVAQLSLSHGSAHAKDACMHGGREV